MSYANKARGSFEVQATSEPYDEAEGASLYRSSYTKIFRGDIEATSQVEVLRAMAATEKSAAYVGIERITGAVGGRPGSFVMQHSGTIARGDMSASIRVVPDTGTGELHGIRGEMAITVADGQHTYEFDYDFED